MTPQSHASRGPRHIIHTIRSLRPEAGGPSYSVPALCAALRDTGAHVELWTSEVTTTPAIDLEIRVLARRELHQRLGALAEQSDSVIVHDHGVWLPWNHAVASACRRSGLQRVVSPRGMLEPWAMGYRATKKWLAWMMYQRADLQSASMLHATSAAEADNFARLGLTAPAVTAPNGVNCNDAVAACHEPVKAVRRLLFLSRIHPKKGLLDLIAAWSRIRPASWKLRIVGPDEIGHRADVVNAARRAGVADLVEFGEPADEVTRWKEYQQADLFVLPTYSENFGLVVAEALSAQVPVITTHGTPWSELQTVGCGWWVPTGSAALEAALREGMALSASDRRLMGEKGRRLIEDRYGWNATAHLLLQGYESVSRRRRD